MSEQLADRIVALGVGKDFGAYSVFRYRIGGSDLLTDKEFVRDGRVVLAMMEKCDGPLASACFYKRGKWIAEVGPPMSEGEDESLAIAILTACCDALEGT